MRFLLELTQYIQPHGSQYIRRHGLYASRTKGKWPDIPQIARLAPTGWKREHLQAHDSLQPYVEKLSYSVSDKKVRSTWAKLIAQVYEVDSMTYSHCGSSMRILTVITEPQEIRKILRQLVKITRSPPGFDPASLN